MLTRLSQTVLTLALFSSLCWGTASSASEASLKMTLPDDAIITMNDGKKYSGAKILSLDETTVTFQKGGVKKTLPKTQIKNIAFSGQYVVYASGQAVRGGWQWPTSGRNH